MNEILANFQYILKNKYAKFDGRARRKEFWYFVLANVIVSIILSSVDMIIGFQLLSGLYGLAVLVPSIAVGVRRLHDIGKSGVFYLLLLVPFVGFYLIYLWTLEGGKEDNQYGSDPKKDTTIFK